MAKLTQEEILRAAQKANAEYYKDEYFLRNHPKECTCCLRRHSAISILCTNEDDKFTKTCCYSYEE